LLIATWDDRTQRAGNYLKAPTEGGKGVCEGERSTGENVIGADHKPNKSFKVIHWIEETIPTIVYIRGVEVIMAKDMRPARKGKKKG
jgi:hypothetical protein